MKKIITLTIAIVIAVCSYSQNFSRNGILPKKTLILGLESGGSLTKIEAQYSPTGKDYLFYSLRTVPKISYSPIKNILTGIYYMREIAVYPDIPTRINYGFGGFVRGYLPFINSFFKINNNNFFNNRLLFFLELYFEKNNFYLNKNKSTSTLTTLSTMFYGAKFGINFRLFSKLYIEIAYAQNFDNRNGDFTIFHPELGIEYFFNFSN